VSDFEYRTSDGTTYLTCLPFEAEGFTAAFSTRDAGAAPEPVEATAARLLEAVGHKGARLATCKQVHSSIVRLVKTDDDVRDRSTECDALTAREPGLFLGIKTADCVPILVADRRTGAVAGIHAGWRGASTRIVERAFAAMMAAWTSRRSDCFAAIGPAVCSGCYEVGAEVLDRFRSEFPYASRLISNPHGDKAHLDLKTACVVQLELCGFKPDQIFVSDACTICENDRYPSYRKEGARAGRILSIVGLAPGA
jgi:YfiH family protein